MKQSRDGTKLLHAAREGLAQSTLITVTASSVEVESPTLRVWWHVLFLTPLHAAGKAGSSL